MFKPRSKSIGRSPSRSFSSERKEQLEKYNTSDDLSNENDDNPLLDETDKLERIGILSDFTNELDKKSICGNNLDIIVKNMFDKYNTNSKSNTASQIFLSLNKCRDRVNISPPKNLSSTKKKIDIDRLSKYQRIFNAIPIFDNTQEFSIRDLLCNLNQICEGLGFEVNRNEFEILLNQKLSAKVKTAIRSYNISSLEDFYNTLINIYDRDYTKREAFSALMNNKKSYSNIKDFTEETLKLLTLSQKDIEEQAKIFVHACENVVPIRIFEKIVDYVDTFESLNEGKHPLLPNIIDILYKHKIEIDAYLGKTHKSKANTFNMLQTTEDGSVNQERFCTICEKPGHENNNCFKTKTCQNCFKQGHIDKYCKKEKFCSSCNRKGHIATSCFTRCRLCNEQSHQSVQCPKYKGQEPSQEPCSKCLNSMFIKLYHPSSKCKSFSSKN